LIRATLYPGKNELNWRLIKKVLNKAYWPIYGDLKVLDEIEYNTDEETCSASEDGCPDSIGSTYSYISLMVYMIIANVLLINLLIAMFR
jgi:hypothetical protein